MKSKTVFTALRLAAIGAALLAAASCGKKDLGVGSVTNQLPTVRITGAPIDSNEICSPDPVQSCYSLTLHWVGYDPDGRVSHYLYAIDPPSEPEPGKSEPDTVWYNSSNNEERLLFSSKLGVQRGPADNPVWIPKAREYHVFVIKAVDNSGGVGPSVARAFYSFTQAPDVYITNPLPSSISRPLLTPSVRISWTGTDEDGVFNSKPVKYKYILLNPSSVFPVQLAIEKPDSLRAFYEPDFSEWDSVGGDTTTVQYTNLAPNQEYMFVVVAFDEAGAYSPIFNLNKNMLRFGVGFAGALGPAITAFNEFFNYTWRPGYCVCRATETFIEVPAGRPVTFNWFAEPPEGADIRSYRWCMDSDNLSNETPRPDERNPEHFHLWSSRSLNNVSVVLPPFAGTIPPDPPEEHVFYIEAEDNVGFRSLGTIRFQVVRSDSADRYGRLLVVKDTRMKPEQYNRQTNCVQHNPPVIWPTQAELDTFLFARGNTPWRCLPEGTITPPGLFNGYSFDTVGTRKRQTNLTVPLSTLSRYEYIVWMVDQIGANFSEDGTGFFEPMTAMRYMNGPGRFNTLAAFIKDGGKVWLMGGGGGMASNINEAWNDRSNDVPTFTFSSRGARPELRPGRFMYDIARWQSEYRVSAEPALVRRFLGRYENTQPTSGPSAYMQYAHELPAILEFRTPATDPMPPNRTNTGRFYPQVVGLEYLQAENFIIENTSDDPERPFEESTLDTFYRASGGGLFPPQTIAHNVVMTYYHGPAVPHGFIFTGFDVWTWRRNHCQQFVDFVLHRMWGLEPNRTASFRRASVEASSPSPQLSARAGPRPSPTAVQGRGNAVRKPIAKAPGRRAAPAGRN